MPCLTASRPTAPPPPAKATTRPTRPRPPRAILSAHPTTAVESYTTRQAAHYSGLSRSTIMLAMRAGVLPSTYSAKRDGRRGYLAANYVTKADLDAWLERYHPIHTFPPGTSRFVSCSRCGQQAERGLPQGPSFARCKGMRLENGQ